MVVLKNPHARVGAELAVAAHVQVARADDRLMSPPAEPLMRISPTDTGAKTAPVCPESRPLKEPIILSVHLHIM
jgi:hypothetical protein